MNKKINIWSLKRLDLITYCIRLEEKNKHKKITIEDLNKQIKKLHIEIEDLKEEIEDLKENIELKEPNYIYEI